MPSPKPIPIFDGHNDVLLRLYRRAGAEAVTAFLQGEDKGHLDLPKAREADLPAACLRSSCRRRNARTAPAAKRRRTSAASSATTPRRPRSMPRRRSGPSLPWSRCCTGSSAKSQGRVRVCRNAGDIEGCLADDVLAAVLHIEGAEAIDANFELLDVLYAAGLRSLGPVWSRPNVFGHGVPFRCPSSPDIGPGLTDLGKALIGACNRLADSDRSVASQRARLLGRRRTQQCAAGCHALQCACHQPAFAQSDRPAVGCDPANPAAWSASTSQRRSCVRMAATTRTRLSI